jgi:hypothetical protein
VAFPAHGTSIFSLHLFPPRCAPFRDLRHHGGKEELGLHFGNLVKKIPDFTEEFPFLRTACSLFIGIATFWKPAYYFSHE